MELAPNIELKQQGDGANLLAYSPMQQAAAPVLGDRSVSPDSADVMPNPEATHQDPEPAPNMVSDEIKKLGRHSSHYLAGLVAKLGLGFISLPIFTRVFSVADYGLIDLIGKVLLFMTALSKMGLQQSAMRFFDGKRFAKDRESAQRYYSTMFFGSILTSVIVALCFIAASRLFLKSLIDAPLSAVIGVVSILIVLRAMQSMLWSFLRSEERTKAYNIAAVACRASTIAIVCLLLPWLGRTVRTYYSGAMAAEMAVVLVFTCWLLRRGILNPTRFDAGLLRAGLLFGCPLILYEVSTIVLDAADRVLVRYYLGAEPLGIYSVAYGLASQLNDLLVFPLGLAIFPIYMRLWASEGREATTRFLSTCLDLFLAVAAGVSAIAVVASRDGLVLLASPKYHGAERLIPLLVMGLLIYTTHIFLCAGLLIHKKTGTMAVLLLGSAAVNIGLNCMLLPRIGLEGAAIATLVSYAVCILLLGWTSARFLPLDVRFRAFATYLFAAALVAIAVSRIELKPVILNLVVRSALTLVLYSGLLYLLDPNIRGLATKILRHLSTRRDNSVTIVHAVSIADPSDPRKPS